MVEEKILANQTDHTISRRFAREYLEKYPDLTIPELEVIADSTFKFVKDTMNSEVLKDIRFKYFGTFKVSKGKIYYGQKYIEENYKKGTMPDELYKRKIKMFESYEPRERKSVKKDS